MAHASGKDLYLIVKGTVITGDQREFSWTRSTDTIDTSAGADTDRSSLARLRDMTMSLRMLDNGTVGSAIRRALTNDGTAGTVQWAPIGTAAGNPKYECQAYVTGFDESYPFDGEIEYNVSFQRTGAMVADFDDSNLKSIYS